MASVLENVLNSRLNASIIPNVSVNITYTDAGFFKLRSNKIFQLDIAGNKIGETNILHPSSVAQDSKLDLLVCCETIVNRDSIHQDTIGAIERIQLSKFGFRLGPALPTGSTSIVWKERRSPKRRFSSIIVVSGNQYIASRIGPDNSSPSDPDSRLLWFKKTDSLITPISDLQTGVGSGITFLNKPTGLISFPRQKSFIVTQTSEGVSYGAILMVYIHDIESERWIPGFDPSIPSQRVDFITPNQFSRANGGTLDPNRGDIFIVNVVNDSSDYAVFKFDIKGKFKKESIHPYSVSPPLLYPISAAYFDKVIYIAQPTRINRFKLSSDFNH